MTEDAKKTTGQSSHAGPVSHATKAAPRKQISFAEVLKDVDPTSLADEQEALQAAYEAIPGLPSPKDPKKAQNVAWLKDKIRTTIGRAHGGVTQAISALEEIAPLVEKLGVASAEIDEKSAAELAEKTAAEEKAKK